MNLDNMTLQDCINEYKKGKTAVINDGAGSFCEEPAEINIEVKNRD